MNKSFLLISILFIFLLLTLGGCTSLTLENLVPKYDYIQSYPEGGGIFPISVKSPETLDGNITVDLSCDPELHAQLNINAFNTTNTVGELTIQPSDNISEGIHKILLISTEDVLPKGRILEVEIFNISHGGPSSYIQGKKDEFLDWLELFHLEYENISDQTWFAYRTYTQILVVEHWTFLNSEYELRICCHITTSPYNWSKMMLRYRGEIEPVIAAHREYDGVTSEINVSDYPIMYGY